MGPEPPASPAVSVVPAASVVQGQPLQFPVRADPAPSADLTVGVTIVLRGCALAQAPTSVTIAAGKTETTLTVPIGGAVFEADDCTVTATIVAGTGYRVVATAASASATVTPKPAVPTEPEVTITATASTVTEGDPVSFTLTAMPPPASALTVYLKWSDPGLFLDGSPPQTVTIPTSGTVELEADTVDDNADEPDGPVTARIAADSGYRVGASGSATVDVTDNDAAVTASSGPTTPRPGKPVVTVTAPDSVSEGDTIAFTFTASPPPTFTLAVYLNWSTPYVTLSALPRKVTISTAGTGSFSVQASRVRADGEWGVAIVSIAVFEASYTLGDPYVAAVFVDAGG